MTEPLDSYIGDPIDWAELFATEFDPEDRWLVPGLIAQGRNHIVVAAAGAGKSEFLLWSLTRASMGFGLDNEPIPKIRVLYLDWEMGADDLQDRMQSFGLTEDDAPQLERVVYMQPPELAGLDIPPRPGEDDWPGGRLAQFAGDHEIDVVVFDTYSRTCFGDENSNDTHIAWYANTGQILKELGIATVRLDHEGHSTEAKGRARGGSAKIGDVDVALYLHSEKAIDRTTVDTTKARMSWYPTKHEFRRSDVGGIVSYDRWSGSRPQAGEPGEELLPSQRPYAGVGLEYRSFERPLESALPDRGGKIEDPEILGLVLDHLGLDPGATLARHKDTLAQHGWGWKSEKILSVAVKLRRDRIGLA